VFHPPPYVPGPPTGYVSTIRIPVVVNAGPVDVAFVEATFKVKLVPGIVAKCDPDAINVVALVCRQLDDGTSIAPV
jgi:hypothetical protein